jgi:hypothetical protein
MSIILQDVNTSHKDSLRLLQDLDLTEWQADHHWASFEQNTIAAQCHLEKYDECLARIKVIKAELNRALCPVEMVP